MDAVGVEVFWDVCRGQPLCRVINKKRTRSILEVLRFGESIFGVVVVSSSNIVHPVIDSRPGGNEHGIACNRDRGFERPALGKFVVSNAGEAYDARAKILHRIFRTIPATAPELPA